MFNLEGRTPVFMDLEFTGLHQKTTLMSIALVIGNRQFYAELTDYDETQLNPWLQTNVVENFMLDSPGWEESENAFMVKGTTKEVVKKLKEFLESLGPVYIVSDVLAYDWVLFCELFGGAFGIPSMIYYIPFDLATAFKIKGIDPDVNREEFAGIIDSTYKHNALHDAKVIQACWDKLNIE